MANVTRLTIIKFFELILVCILIGLHFYSLDTLDLNLALTTMGIFGGYLIILVGLFAGSFMGTPVNRRVDLFYSLIGCALFIIAGALTIHHFDRFSSSSFRSTGLAKGSLSVIEGALFLADAFLTFRGEA